MGRHANIVSFSDVKAASQMRYTQNGPARPLSARSVRDDGEYFGFSRFAQDDFEEDDFEDEPANGRSSRKARKSSSDSRESRRRERAKARADKLFAKQYSSEPRSSAQEEGAPRAALYEGQMGSSQRRAARMQEASSAKPAMAKLNPAGWFSGLTLSPGRLRAVTAIVCVVLAIAFLYTPAQHYYQAMREHDRLAAEYASVEERNEALMNQNVSLASDAGMEDAVRQKYGYVVEGEETAIVSGLSEGASNTHGDGVEANVLSSSVKAPEEWYTPYLDALFGVS